MNDESIKPAYSTCGASSASGPTVDELREAMEKARELLGAHPPAVDAFVLTSKQWERVKSRCGESAPAPKCYQELLPTIAGVRVYVGRSPAEVVHIAMELHRDGVRVGVFVDEKPTSRPDGARSESG